MKISIIFLTLLFTVSCNIDASSDAAFLELSKDARAEAVLATVAIQMQQSNGFEKVQSLLTELLDTARANMHKNNVLNRKATARCQVYNHKLSERSEYLNSVVESLTAEQATVQEAERHASEHIQSSNAMAASYTALNAAEAKRFTAEKNFYSGLRTTINGALNSVAAVAAQLKVNKPSPKFIQTSIKEITESYSKVFNVNIDLPESFIEMSIDNNAARRRILTWLEDIRGTFSSMIASIDSDAARRNTNNAKFTALLTQVAVQLKAENVMMANVRVKYTELTKSYASNIAAFSNFRTRNAANLKENTEYCAAESAGYAKVSSNDKSNVRVYEELMTYFLENYRRISSMIAAKYNKLA
jgi:hypothetical protein